MFHRRTLQGYVRCCRGDLTISEGSAAYRRDKYANEVYHKDALAALDMRQVIFKMLSVENQDPNKFKWTFVFSG